MRLGYLLLNLFVMIVLATIGHVYEVQEMTSLALLMLFAIIAFFVIGFLNQFAKWIRKKLDI